MKPRKSTSTAGRPYAERARDVDALFDQLETHAAEMRSFLFGVLAAKVAEISPHASGRTFVKRFDRAWSGRTGGAA